MTEPETARMNMIKHQLQANGVTDDRVLAVMSEVPREKFLEPALQGVAYAEIPLPIGYGQTTLIPLVEGRLLQALALLPEHTVLEIGTGSGYFTALLAKLAGSVISVEYFEALSVQAQARLEVLGLHNVDFQVGDAAKGWLLPDRVDAIVITAAFETLPEDYLNQLKVGGRLLGIVGREPAMSVVLVTRLAEREWQTASLFETVVAPMIHAEPKPKFEF